MTEAIFGLIGVIVGSAISWFQMYWAEKRAIRKNARYLAIRVMCVLDKYLEDCADVVRDDGLCYGQRTKEGYLEPQVKAPGPPALPNDVDWKSIDPDLMYRILSLPSDIEAAERLIRDASNVAESPDFEEFFIERAYWYASTGLSVYKISADLSKKYDVPMKTYQDWNPAEELTLQLAMLTERRQKRRDVHRRFIDKILGKK
ncbi:hypothetical protein M1D52_07305 [Olivibacter sp. SA151]|uniref:hypothetical protein n=1 Tax=Olivibacter jilunii TaxID=985016 RepID=UPI003F1668F8